MDRKGKGKQPAEGAGMMQIRFELEGREKENLTPNLHRMNDSLDLLLKPSPAQLLPSFRHPIPPSPATFTPLPPQPAPVGPRATLTVDNDAPSPSPSAFTRSNANAEQDVNFTRAAARGTNERVPVGSLSTLRRQVWDNLRREGGDQQKRERRVGSASSASVSARPAFPAASSSFSTRLSPTSMPASRGQVLAPETETVLLSTEGLSPLRHMLKVSGSIEIIAPPSSANDLPKVLVDVRARNGMVYLIDGDGKKISIFSNCQEGLLILLQPNETYSRRNLPTKYEKIYNLATKFVEGVRSKLPKIVFYTRHSTRHQVKHTVFSDSPSSYELSLRSPNPLIVRIDRRKSQITIRHSAASSSSSNQSQHPLKLSLPPSPQALNLLSEGEQLLIKLGLERLEFVDRSVSSLESSESSLTPLQTTPSRRYSLHLSTSSSHSQSALRRSQKLRSRAPSLTLSPPPPPPPTLPPSTTSPTHRTISQITRAIATPAPTLSNPSRTLRPPSQARSTPRSRVNSPSPSRPHSRSRSRRNSLIRGERAAGSVTVEKEEKSDRRCLRGAGWIVRETTPAVGEVEEKVMYRVLFGDGQEMLVDPVEQKILDRDYWHKIDERLPMRVKMRLQIVKEMMELF